MFRRLFGLTCLLTLLSLTLAQEPAKPGSKGKPTDPAAKPKNPPGPEAMVDMILQRMDANKDGKISRSEAQGRILENFDRIDTNKDGYLDRWAKWAAPVQAAAPSPARDPIRTISTPSTRTPTAASPATS